MLFITNDTKQPTYIWSKNVYSTHRVYHLKTPDNKVWTEIAYKGDATFGGKSLFALIAELNATTAMLAKNDPVELGRKIYDGSIKLISRKGGIVCPREIQWPSILEDDERKWTNIKPVFATTNIEPPKNNEYECECDLCISVI